MPTKYWVGGTGIWDTGHFSHWSLSSGGAGGNLPPNTGENAIFDGNSGLSGGSVITIDSGAGCQNLDMSGVSNNITVQPASNSVFISIFGNCTIPSNITFDDGGGAVGIYLIFQATGSVNIASTTFKWGITANACTVNMAHNLALAGFKMVAGGIINTNNYALTYGKMDCSNGTFNAGSSVMTWVPTTIEWNGSQLYISIRIDPNNGIYNEGTSSIIVQGDGELYAYNEAFNNIHFVSTNGVYTNYFVFAPPALTQDFDFNDWGIDPGCKVYFFLGNGGTNANPTINIAGTYTANGSSGSHAIMDRSSDSSGGTWNINAAVTSISYLEVGHSTAGGAASPFDATANCTDLGGNTNWTFVTGPFYKTVAVSADLETSAVSSFLDLIKIDNVNFNFATVQGIINNLDFSFDQIGITWSDSTITPTPVNGDPYVILFGVLGPFYVNLTNLIPGHTYYLRIYVLNGGTYIYGFTITFTVPVVNPLEVISTDNLVSKYQFELLNQNDELVADLSGYIDNRHFTITRNRADDISFTIDLDILSQLAHKLKVEPQDLLQTGIQTIRVRRAGNPITAGQITYWNANLATKQISVRAKGWLELFSYRVFSGTYTNKDFAFIVRDVINQTQALSYGSFGIILGTNAAGTNTYALKEFENKTISDIIIEGSEEEDGPDFQFTWDKRFNLYMPGQGTYRQDIIFTFPGNTKDIDISSDSTQIINSLLARGKGNANASIDTIVGDVPSMQIYRLRTGVKDYPDMDADQLVNTAAADVFFYKNPLTLHTVKYDGGNPACPSVGSFSIGDKVRILVKELKLFSDLNTFFTIDKIDVNIGKNDEEDVTLALNNQINS